MTCQQSIVSLLHEIHIGVGLGVSCDTPTPMRISCNTVTVIKLMVDMSLLL